MFGPPGQHLKVQYGTQTGVNEVINSVCACVGSPVTPMTTAGMPVKEVQFHGVEAVFGGER